MLLATKGDTRDVLWNVDPADSSDNPNCLSDMMEILNKEFDKPEWEKADHAAEQFEKCRRAPGEKMIAYLHSVHRTYTKVLKEDKGSMISDTSMARRILRRSSLSADEQCQVLSSCGRVYDMDKIKDALRLTYGDTHKDDRKRPFATRNNFPNNSNGRKGGGKPPWRPRKYGTNHVDPIDHEQDDYEYDEEDEEDGDEQDGQDDHEEDQDEDEDAEQDPEVAPEDEDDQDEDEDLQELFGAFVQFVCAGKKMRSKFKG